MKTYSFIVQYFAKKALDGIKKTFPAIAKWYTQHFPAVRLTATTSPLEYSLNFSSEILVGILVVIVALANIVIFNPFSQAPHQDKSLSAYLLRYHSEYNEQLAIKQNTVSTTVSTGNFISKAFASSGNIGSVLGDSTTAPTETTLTDGIEDNGISKANPDSVQKLISRQVQIYETQPFDTVWTVAEKFGVSTQTIRESNGLPNNALKAGWQLVIPPVNGIVVKVETDLSLYDISQKYGANLDKVVSYNGLDGPDSEVALGEYLIIPGGKLPETPKPQETKPERNSTKNIAISKPSVPRAAFVGSNKFAAGNCTAYVASRTKVYWRGNANMWATNARRAGAVVDRNPVPGAIIQTNESRYGHVGYIEKVNGSQITFSEWNYAGLYVKTVRTLSINDPRVKAIIHP